MHLHFKIRNSVKKKRKKIRKKKERYKLNYKSKHKNLRLTQKYHSKQEQYIEIKMVLLENFRNKKKKK